MPTSDRRPRPRLARRAESAITNHRELRAAIASCRGNDDEWREIRPAVARFIGTTVADANLALRIAEAYRRRPELIPPDGPR